MQSASSRIWTRLAVSIFYDANHYTTGAFTVDMHSSIVWKKSKEQKEEKEKRTDLFLVSCSFWNRQK